MLPDPYNTIYLGSNVYYQWLQFQLWILYDVYVIDIAN